MMRFLKDSAFVLLTALTSLSTTSNAIYTYKYLYQGIGPLEYGVDEYLSFRFRCYLEHDTKISEYVSVSIHGERIFYSEGKQLKVIEEKNYPIYFNIPIKNYLTSKGLDLNLRVYNENDNAIFNDMITIYPTNCKTIDPFILDNNTYTSGPLEAELKHFWDLKECLYDFSNLRKSIENEAGKYLSFKPSYFIYDSPYEFQYKEAYIRFLDSNSLFPYMRKNMDGYIHLPIQLIENEGKVSVIMNNTYYYNENTRYISNYRRSGYVETTYFYLPNNFKNYSQNYQFEVVFKDIGMDKLDVIYELDYDDTPSFFGLCSDSENCIIGGIRK